MHFPSVIHRPQNATTEYSNIIIDLSTIKIH